MRVCGLPWADLDPAREEVSLAAIVPTGQHPFRNPIRAPPERPAHESPMDARSHGRWLLPTGGTPRIVPALLVGERRSDEAHHLRDNSSRCVKLADESREFTRAPSMLGVPPAAKSHRWPCIRQQRLRVRQFRCFNSRCQASCHSAGPSLPATCAALSPTERGSARLAPVRGHGGISRCLARVERRSIRILPSNRPHRISVGPVGASPRAPRGLM